VDHGDGRRHARDLVLVHALQSDSWGGQDPSAGGMAAGNCSCLSCCTRATAGQRSAPSGVVRVTEPVGADSAHPAGSHSSPGRDAWAGVGSCPTGESRSDQHGDADRVEACSHRALYRLAASASESGSRGRRVRANSSRERLCAPDSTRPYSYRPWLLTAPRGASDAAWLVVWRWIGVLCPCILFGDRLVESAVGRVGTGLRVLSLGGELQVGKPAEWTSGTWAHAILEG
jgi:hypothetical protein